MQWVVGGDGPGTHDQRLGVGALHEAHSCSSCSPCPRLVIRCAEHAGPWLPGCVQATNVKQLQARIELHLLDREEGADHASALPIDGIDDARLPLQLKLRRVERRRSQRPGCHSAVLAAWLEPNNEYTVKTKQHLV